MTADDEPNDRAAPFSRLDRQLSPAVTGVLARWIGSSEHAIVVGNRDGVIASANDAWTRITGRTIADTLSKPVADFLIESGIKIDLVEFVQAHFLRGARCEIELPFSPASPHDPAAQAPRSPLWIHLVVESIRNEYGEVSDFVAVAQDVSARKREEEHVRCTSDAPARARPSDPSRARPRMQMQPRSRLDDRHFLACEPSRRTLSTQPPRPADASCSPRAAHACGAELLIDSGVGSGTRSLLLLPVKSNADRA